MFILEFIKNLTIINMRLLTVLVVLLFLSSCAEKKPEKPDLISGDYWKDQALRDIIPFWTRYSQNERSGTFYTNLDSVWKPFGGSEIYPSMISRNLFSYSAAYLMSGEEEYFKTADKTFRWLAEKAWDEKFGGWYDALDEAGNPVLETKTTFVQVYAITGLTLYYFVTRDSSALDYIEKANGLLEEKVWDKTGSGGYFNVMNRDWSISDSNKSFSSQITPVSGYLIYLYLATGNQRYRQQINRILEVVTNKMIDKNSGWVLEDFDRDWKYLTGEKDFSEINIGHNIETAWMLLKNYLLNPDADYPAAGMRLAEQLFKSGALNSKNIWLASVSRTEPWKFSPDTYWWIQAYGNMISLYLYKVTGDKKYIDYFKRGADLWDSKFMDYTHGDSFFRIDSAGNLLDATKATRFKASYHNMEHCLLNYLCLNLWVNRKPVELYFRINTSKDGDILYPVLIEDKTPRIEKVVAEDHSTFKFRSEGQKVILPACKESKIKVIVAP